MANYGKILVPLGVVSLIPGIVIMSMYQQDYGTPLGAIISFAFAALFIVIGLPRLVQGKERKIMGKIIRPKAAARSSAIWAMIIFNSTPFLIPGSRIMNYSAPMPMAIWLGGYWRRSTLGYTWLPGVIIGFFALFIIGLLLSGKFPKLFHVVFNFFYKTFVIFL